MKFVYPARLLNNADDEVIVSFRDLPWCHTSGADNAEALAEAEDALEEAIAGCINHNEAIPLPSEPFPGEYLVPVPAEMAAKAALALAFRASGLTRVALARRLGVDDKVVRRMLDPRHRTSVNRLNDALRILGSEAVLEVRETQLSR